MNSKSASDFLDESTAVLSPEATKSAKKKLDKQFGEGYYDMLLQMGVAAGVPERDMSRQLGVTVAEFRELKKKYSKDIRDLQVHRAVCDRVFPELTRVRMTSLQMKLLDTLFHDLEDTDSRLNNDHKVRADLLKFLARHLESVKLPDQDSEEDLTDEEVRQRAMRLMDGE